MFLLRQLAVLIFAATVALAPAHAAPREDTAVAVTAADLSANGTVVVPAGYAIRDIFFNNKNANAVTGGVDIGTTLAGTDVVSALAVGANTFGNVAAASILARSFSVTDPQTLYINAHTAWNSADVDFTITLDKASVVTIGAMPANGLLGFWRANDYQTVAGSTKAVLPNKVTNAAVPQNLAYAQRRQFGLNPAGTQNVWTTSGVTITDDYATAADGSHDASRAVAAAASGGFLQGSAVFAGGVHSIWLSCLSNTGGSQTFNMVIGATTTSVTCTTSWSRLTSLGGTPGAGANNYNVLKESGAGFDIKIADVYVCQGTSDCGSLTPTISAHLQLGDNTNVTHIPSAPSGGFVDLHSKRGIIQFQTAQNLASGFTMQTVINTDTSSAGIIQAFMGDYDSDGGGWIDLSAYYWWGITSTPIIASNGGKVNVPSPLADDGLHQRLGLYNLDGTGDHVVTVRNTGSIEELWIDDAMMFTRAVPFTLPSVKDFSVNIANGRLGAATYGAWAMWNRSITTPELLQSVAYLQNYFQFKNAVNLASSRFTRRLFAVGDSLTTGNDFDTYVYLGAPYSPVLQGSNMAVSAIGIDDLIASAPTIDKGLPPTGGGYLSVLIGTNDLLGWPGATDALAMANYYNNSLCPYIQARMTAGWKVAVGTVLPRDNAVWPVFNTRRNILNPLIRAGVGTCGNAVFDFAANATMGVDNSYALHPGDWSDQIHPNLAGQTILAPIFQSTINAMPYLLKRDLDPASNDNTPLGLDMAA